jgi:signal transduction histidine kinase
MTFNGRHSASLARLLVVVVGGVVVSFLLVTMFARWNGRRVDGIIARITDQALPSVRALAVARGELRRLDDEALHGLEAWREGRPRGTGDSWRSAIGPDTVLQLREERAAVTSAFEAYERAAAPEDEPQRAQAREHLAEAGAALDELTRSIEAGDGSAAEDALDRHHAAVDRTDDVLDLLVNRNAARAAALGTTVRVTRSRTRLVVAIMDAGCVLLALFAAALSFVQMRRIVQSLEAANRMSEERAAELDLFAGRAAHDLVGPLAAPSFALQAIGRQVPDDERVQKAVRRGLSGLERASEVASGLLEFARAGAPRDVSASAPVEDVARDCVDAVQKGAEAEGVDVRLDASEPCRVACNAGVLTSILANLLRNAIKYVGDSPRREVRLQAVKRDHTCRMAVIDTGPGVPCGYEEKIFEPFVRAQTDKPGVGLGLATVRRLASAYGGTAGYQRIGDRSVFWVNLPIAERKE